MSQLESKFNEAEVWYKKIATELAAAGIIAFALWLLDESQKAFSQLSGRWITPAAGFVVSFASIWFLTARKEKGAKSLYTDFLPFLSTQGHTVRLGYTIYDHAEFSHCGECVIEVENGQARIDGQRHYMRDKSDTDELVVYQVFPKWHSEWCLISPDGYLRFLYNIDMPGEIVRGICEMRPDSGAAATEMSGSYQLLYPGKLCEFAPASGTITFEIIGDKPVVPPAGARLAQGPARRGHAARQRGRATAGGAAPPAAESLGGSQREVEHRGSGYRYDDTHAVRQSDGSAQES
jgi:hypothetical protein